MTKSKKTNPMKTQKWLQLPLDGCVSSNGKPYQVSIKKGPVNKLLINFVGGGLSWNEETATKPVTIGALIKKKEFYYIANVLPLQLKLINIGILSEKDKRNPFHNWSVLTIPYSSGDFHMGNNDYSYKDSKGKDKTLHHHGEKNVSAALSILKELLPETPETLVIAGQSAGGFGCLAHSPQISKLYPQCNNIVVYSEVSHFRWPLWPEIAENVWKVRPDLMAYIKSNNLVVDLFHYAKDNMPSSTLFLHMNTVWDKELTSIMYKMNHDKKEVNPQGLEEFHLSLVDAVSTLKKDIPKYHYYLTDYGKSPKDGTTPHTVSGSSRLFYAEMEDGVSLANWLCKATEGMATDVGSKFMV